MTLAGILLSPLLPMQYLGALTEISDEEKSLCKDIMPDAKVYDDGTVTMTFADGTTTTETCDYWIEQQAIGAIFPTTTWEPDKELTERAIKFRASQGLNASGSPTQTYGELTQNFQDTPTTGNELTNTNSVNLDLGLDLTYPQGWSISPGDYTILSSPNDKASLSIYENPFTGFYKDLASWADNDIADFQRNGTISPIQKTINTISGNPAITLHFNFGWSYVDLADGLTKSEGDYSEYQITYIDYGGRFFKFEYYGDDNESFLKYLSDINNIITSASLVK